MSKLNVRKLNIRGKECNGSVSERACERDGGKLKFKVKRLTQPGKDVKSK